MTARSASEIDAGELPPKKPMAAESGVTKR